MSFSDAHIGCTGCCGEYECSFCPGRKFPNPFALIKHLRKDIEHREQRDSLKSLRCAKCNEDFTGKFDFIHHLKHNLIHKYDLHQAACCGRFQDVGQLIYNEDAGVTGASHEVNPSQQMGLTPMHCAAFMGYSR